MRTNSKLRRVLITMLTVVLAVQTLGPIPVLGRDSAGTESQYASELEENTTPDEGAGDLDLDPDDDLGPLPGGVIAPPDNGTDPDNGNLDGDDGNSGPPEDGEDGQEDENDGSDDDINEDEDEQEDDDEDGNEPEPEPGIFSYSKRALRELLTNLAEELGMGEPEWLDWLFEADHFTEDTRRDIYDALREQPERAASFFAATDELYDELRPTTSSKRSDAERASSEGLDDIQAVGERLQRSLDRTADELFTLAAAADPAINETRAVSDIGNDRWLRSLTRVARDATISGSGAGSGAGMGPELIPHYRHYELELGFELAADGADGDADIVLLIDSSLSTQNKSNSIRAAASYFVSLPQVYGSGSRLSIVAFSDDGSILVPLTDAAGEDGGPNQELLSAINSLRAQGQSNLQAGLMAAREALELDDSSYPDDGRTRAVILLSDGAGNERLTDIWTLRIEFEGSRARWYYDIDIDWDGETTAPGAKRWSYLDDVAPAGRVYVDGSRLSAGITTSGNGAVDRMITRLEAQHLVSQGVDLYGVDYGGQLTAYMEELTLSLDGEVDFSAGVEEPAYDVPTRPRKNHEGNRLYDPAQDGFVEALAADLLESMTVNTPVMTLLDELDAGFELDPEADWTWLLVTPDGEEVERPGGWTLSVSLDRGELEWTTPAGLTAGNYTIRYRVRVRDDEEDPFLHWPDGQDDVDPSTEVTISHSEGSYSFEDATVLVPPLLGITASGPDAAFVGGEVVLEGEIFRGNGGYTYAWYEPDNDEPVLVGNVPLDGIDPVEGLGLEIPVPELTLTMDETGVLRRILEVTDTRAWDAGYSGGRQRVELDISVVGGELIVEVVGEDGVFYGGRFETTIRYTGAGGETAVSHLMGPGRAVYDASTGLRQGRYEVSLYVPYGYRAVEPIQAVDIAPVLDPDGNWSDCSQTVTVHVLRTWPGYFYGWTTKLAADLSNPGGEGA